MLRKEVSERRRRQVNANDANEPPPIPDRQTGSAKPPGAAKPEVTSVVQNNIMSRVVALSTASSYDEARQHLSSSRLCC